jgi:hypothetical protein
MQNPPPRVGSYVARHVGAKDIEHDGEDTILAADSSAIRTTVRERREA